MGLGINFCANAYEHRTRSGAKTSIERLLFFPIVVFHGFPWPLERKRNEHIL